MGVVVESISFEAKVTLVLVSDLLLVLLQQVMMVACTTMAAACDLLWLQCVAVGLQTMCAAVCNGQGNIRSADSN